MAFAGVKYLAVKQVYEDQTRSNGTVLKVPIPGDNQLVSLAPELICMAWAGALLESTKRHIARTIETKGSPPFPVPEMRFVEYALAKETGGAKNSFLVEEFIDENKGGPFVKYIHNSTSAIRDMPDERGV